PAWKFISLPNKWKPKPLAAHGTAHGATAAPKLIPKTNILKPESRRSSSGLYKPPTISETLGFNKPVPTTIKAIETYKTATPADNDKAMCPNIISTPPMKTVFREPHTRSESHPPTTLDR